MRDCKHDKLARSCNECDLERQLQKAEELIENMITDATNDDTKNYTHKWLRAAAIYRREKEEV